MHVERSTEDKREMCQTKPIGVVLLFLVAIPPLSSTCQTYEASSQELNRGPWIDELQFVVMSEESQADAILADSIDIVGGGVGEDRLDELQADENISVNRLLGNGYGYLTINCDKYPFNIAAFRRAFAFALDKNAIVEQVLNGEAIPLDSPVPKANPLSLEGQLDYCYYNDDSALGLELLDEAGFLDIDSDGFREAPNGSDFRVVIEVARSATVPIAVGDAAAEALGRLQVDAECRPTEFYECLNRLYIHGDYDMVFTGQSFADYDLEWLAYEYWSEYADEPYWNFPNFRNVTYDFWRDQLLHASDYAGYLEAVYELQSILVYEVPIVVCYENLAHSAYRTDRFEGQVKDDLGIMKHWWTFRNIRLKESVGGPVGGLLRVSIPYGVDTLNPMKRNTAYADLVLGSLYDSLLAENLEGGVIPWLATEYQIAEHGDDDSIPEGHQRMVFEINEMAGWSDGNQMTGADVAFTVNFYMEAIGNRFEADVERVVSAYSPDNSTFVVEFNCTSSNNLRRIGLLPILPRHTLLGLAPSDWDIWDPAPQNLVCSGSFLPKSNSRYVLVPNPYHFTLNSKSAPRIDHPDDMIVFVGGTGEAITWHPEDIAPRRYLIYEDGTLTENNTWDGNPVATLVNHLPLGSHNITLVVLGRNDTANDTVKVEVQSDDSDPILTCGGHVTYLVGSTGNSIWWTLTDEHPSRYVVYRDGADTLRNTWNATGETVTIVVDGLQPGTYNFTLVAYDRADNQASATITVTVQALSDLTPVVAAAMIVGAVILGTAWRIKKK